MPLAPSYPQIAAWFTPLLTAITYGAPLLLLAVLFFTRRSWRTAELVAVVAASILVLGLATTLGWYIRPDYAGSPRAALLSVLILVGPPLVASAVSFHATAAEERWSRAARGWVALGWAYGIMALCLVPALITFVSLGGDTL